eukprot:52024-Eustigmatos_ZCMA.PRE.1
MAFATPALAWGTGVRNPCNTVRKASNGRSQCSQWRWQRSPPGICKGRRNACNGVRNMSNWRSQRSQQAFASLVSGIR